MFNAKSLTSCIGVLFSIYSGYPSLSLDGLQDRCNIDGVSYLTLSIANHSDERNYIGASIFVSYIISALIVTALILKSLISSYKSIRAEKSYGLVLRIRVFGATSLLSFLVLSYNMLLFLVQSYMEWIDRQKARNSVHFSSVWTWTTRSPLFYDFAHELVASREAVRWTRLALTASMMANFYMNSIQRSLKMPSITLFIIIGQILPPSFSLNLFFLAVLLHEEKVTHESIYRQQNALSESSFLALLQEGTILFLCFLYSCFINFFPCSVDRLQFISYVLITRILLAIPFLTPVVGSFEVSMVMTTSFILISTILWDFGLKNLVLDQNHVFGHAVKALGIDFLILSGTVVLWIVFQTESMKKTSHPGNTAKANDSKED